MVPGKSFGPALLSLEYAMCEPPGEDLFKMQIQISRSGWGLGVCILASIPGGTKPARPRTTLRSGNFEGFVSDHLFHGL